MTKREDPKTLEEDLRAAWHRYVDLLAPIRPILHAYCLRLTGSLWDAEDLVQDTLLRAFGQWGVTEPRIRNPQGYLLRTATNVWIDTLRRRRTESRLPDAEPDHSPAGGPAPEIASDVRDAGSRLLQRLAPQERAAVLLKEAFDMTLDEIAEILATTTGAVKAALHRGRERLREPEGDAASRRRTPSPELVDRFVDRVRARDVEGLVAMMVEGGSTENVGNSFHIGLDPDAGTPRFLRAVCHGHPEWPREYQFVPYDVRRVEVEEEPVAALFVQTPGGKRLLSVMRLEERDGRIARIRAYAFCPETMRAIGQALGVKVLTGIYRAPTPAPGESWPESEGDAR